MLLMRNIRYRKCTVFYFRLEAMHVIQPANKQQTKAKLFIQPRSAGWHTWTPMLLYIRHTDIQKLHSFIDMSILQSLCIVQVYCTVYRYEKDKKVSTRILSI